MAGGAALRRFGRRNRDAGIDRDHAGLVGEQRIEIELAHLRQVGGELRELDQQQRDRVRVRGRDVAIGLEHARHPRARDQVARERQVERRQRQRLVVDDLDRGAAAAEHDDRAEGRIVGEAGDQFARLGSQDHRMDGDAGDAGVGPRRLARARISATASRTAPSLVRLSRTPPTSDLCTMSGERILTTTVVPSASNGAAAAAASSASRASSAGAIGMA